MVHLMTCLSFPRRGGHACTFSKKRTNTSVVSVYSRSRRPGLPQRRFHFSPVGRDDYGAAGKPDKQSAPPVRMDWRCRLLFLSRAVSVMDHRLYWSSVLTMIIRPAPGLPGCLLTNWAPLPASSFAPPATSSSSSDFSSYISFFSMVVPPFPWRLCH